MKLDASKSIDVRSLVPEIPSTGYVTHSFDSYPSKMIPHMARFLIQQISKPGQTILDPLCGSGSTLIEASLTGRNAIGIDINPLATLLAKAKTNTYDISVLKHQLPEILRLLKNSKRGCTYEFPNCNFWFTPATLRKLGIVKSVLAEYLPTNDSLYALFWQALLSMIVRQCSRADTRGPKPFISKKARQKRKGKHFDPFKFFDKKACQWISAVEEYQSELKRVGQVPTIEVTRGDARMLSGLIARQVDAIVTSPPYLSAQDYYRSSKLQLFILGQFSPSYLRDWSRSVIGSDRLLADMSLLEMRLPNADAEAIKERIAQCSPRKACVFAKYIVDMTLVLSEISKVLVKDGKCAVVLGNNFVEQVPIPTAELIAQLAIQMGLDLKSAYKDKVRDRHVPVTRNGHSGVVEEEYLMIFQRTNSQVGSAGFVESLEGLEAVTPCLEGRNSTSGAR